MISLILSGGVGSRLWPISREKLPKQFSPLFPQSLFSQTALRLLKMGEVQVCTSEKLRVLTEMSILKDGLDISQVYYEPVGRNTAPAIALACKYLLDNNKENEIMGVFPSDHWIDDEAEFSKCIDLAKKCADKGEIVTIGLKPTYPATGFGYVECLTDIYDSEASLKAFRVKGFKEKPDEQTAEAYIKAGHFFWNSGMFVFKVQTMVNAFKEWMPEMWTTLSALESDLKNISDIYSKLPSESIDYGIMEKAKNQVNIPCDIGWSDLGSWDDMAKIAGDKKIESSTEVFENDSKNCYALSDQKKTICFSGVDDLIIVDTDDAILVTQKEKSQTVKDVFNQLKEAGSSLVEEHRFEFRPWGMYRNTYEEQEFKTKVITVNPNQQLSYQSHTKRSEIWVTVLGVGEVVLDDEIIPVKKGVVVTVPLGAKHRMRNTGSEVLKFVEVQLGEYFGEDDITRYEDDYNRGDL